MIEKHPFRKETGVFLLEKFLLFMISGLFVYFLPSATATATATVAPTMGLLPIGNVKFLLFYLI
ncbi:hypothetical protein [Dysosmobacter sp.]|jgi:hypothetical protein|uniref:hypothetical protein n=1 Tax=Dysosmobacter sp. TaxID=2591382 RepID=UPI003AB2A6F1